MTDPVSTRMVDLAWTAFNDKRHQTHKDAMRAAVTAAVTELLASRQAPEGVRIEGWVMGSSFTTNPLLADYWGRCATQVFSKAAILSAIEPVTQTVSEEQGWIPRMDAVFVVAKALAEHLTGKRPTDETAQKAALFLYNCIVQGALSPLYAAPDPRRPQRSQP